ncbi:MAG TPA: hypothetical protein VHK01_03760 [Lacipirellulaceae bacterium]|nr:hypothetical protein [Lacipirellulaceae bacterium]
MANRSPARAWFIIACVGFFFTASATTANDSPPDPPSPKTYDLRYKLVTGDVLRYDVKHRASIRSTIDQTTQEAQTKTDSVKLWKITDVLPNGDIEVMNVVESVHMLNQLPDREPTQYDSRQDKTPPPGFEDAARAVGVPLSVVRMTPAGKVLRRDVKVRQQSVEEGGQIVLRLPDKPVTIGETWDEPFDVKASLENGSTKAVQTRRRHKLTDVKSGIATIEVTYQVLSPIDPLIETQLVQRLMEGEVKFDIEAGRVVSQKMEIDKRILGFAGPTSSMHYIMRMDETLTKGTVAKAEPKPTARKSLPNPYATAPQSTSKAKQTRSPRTSRSNNRQRQTQGAKTYRR